MKQIFIIGASAAYGVGGKQGGWADLVKQYVHSVMYDDGGVGEQYEVFNFALSGATVQFVLDTFPDQMQHYGRSGEKIILVSVGGNNSKAEETPDGFVSTPEEYTDQMRSLYSYLQKHSDQIVFVSGGYVDESKTNPKPNPLTGGKSYFSNERRALFELRNDELCKEMNIEVARPEVSTEEWIEKYCYVDGLHPNHDGHQLLFESVKNKLQI